MKRFLLTLTIIAGSACGQVDALGHPITRGAIPLDASGHPMLDHVVAGKNLQMRALQFDKAWSRFISPQEGPRMSDYVKACESAKQMFPMLHGECRDLGQLKKLFK